MDVLNFLLWPFRQGIWLLKAALWLIAVIVVVMYWSIHWAHAGDQDHKMALSYYNHTATYTLDLQQAFGTWPFRFGGPNGSYEEPPAFCLIPDSPKEADQIVTHINHQAELSVDGSWISRKSGKLYRSYALAGMTVATMRRYLTMMKAHHEDPNHLYCTAEERAENEIVLQVPVLQFTVDLTHEDTTFPNALIILGMWIKGQGAPEDEILESNSHLADVHDPVLTPGQERAIQVLDSVRTGDFWVKTAHENGIRGRDEAIYARAESLKKILDQRLPVKYRNELLEVFASPFRR